MSNEKPNCKLLEKGLNGWHGSGDNLRVSFYSNSLEHCLSAAIEGCVILDKSSVPDDKLVSGVVSGPMPNTALPPNTVDRFNKEDQSTLTNMLPGLGGDFKTLATWVVGNPKRYSSLDRISLDLYTAYWRERGARVGFYRNEKVEWE